MFICDNCLFNFTHGFVVSMNCKDCRKGNEMNEVLNEGVAVDPVVVPTLSPADLDAALKAQFEVEGKGAKEDAPTPASK